MFKRIIYGLVLMLIFCNVGWADYLGIVDRTQNLPVPFFLLDTVGNPASLANGDSIYVQVFDPDGAETFRDSMPYNDASITSGAWEDFAGGQIYVYEEAVATLDGSSTDEGTFAIKVWAQDLTSAALVTPGFHTFQMVNYTLESSLDSAAFAQKAVDSLADVLDSLETQSVWIQDTLYAIIDTLQNQDDWVSTEVTSLKALDSLADVLDSLETQSVWIQDSLYAIIDTLQNQDDWVATEVTALKSLDSLADVLDSLETQSVWIQDSLYAIIDSIQIKWANRTGYDPATDSVIVDVSSADDGLIPAISDTVWDEILQGNTHNIVNSAGRRLRGLGGNIISDGTAQVSGTPTSPETYIILASAESEGDDFYNGALVKIVGGTGFPEQRIIEDYTGATDSATLHIDDGWGTNPDATSQYEIVGANAVEVNHIHDFGVDNIWEYDSANVAGAQAMGTLVKDSAIVDVSAAIASGDGLINAILVSTWARIGVEGEVEDSAGNSTTRIQTNLSEATDNHYNGMMILFRGSTAEANQARRITDYDGTNGWVEWTPALTGIPTDAIPDSFYILPWATVSATAEISDLDMAAIADSVWQALLDEHDGIAGSFGDSAKEWGLTAASALDSGIVSRVVGRMVWGIPAGSGDDSSVIADRDIDTTAAIGTNGLGSGGIASNAITAAKIATDAIDADALATDAIDEIYEYDTTLIGGATSMGRAQLLAGDTALWANIEDMWMNQDSVNVDTSLIGEWLSKAPWEPDTNTISGEVITMLKDTTAYQGAAGALDSTAVYGAVEQLAADSGLTRADSSQRWVVTQFAIRGANADPRASFYVKNTQAGGYGAEYFGDETEGNEAFGFNVRGEHGMGITGQYDEGLTIEGYGTSGSGADVELGSTGTNGRIGGFIDSVDNAGIGDNAITSTAIANNAIGATEIAADAITEAKIADNAIAVEHIATGAITADEIAASAIGSSELAAEAITSSELATSALQAIGGGVWGYVGVVSAAVEDSAGNSTTRVQTNLANSTDNYYNGAMVVFIDATLGADNLYRRITDYDGTNGWMEFDPAVPSTPSAADPLIILPWASVSATAVVSDVNMGAIADSVWEKKLNEFTAVTGSAGDVLLDSIDALISSAGAVANITNADMAAIADSVWQALMNEHDNVVGSFGDSSNEWSGSDSALISRIIGRKVWGIISGSGDDSSTISQRTVDSVGVVGATTSGARTVTLYAIDTIAGAGGTPDTLTGVAIEVQNQTGQRVLFDETNTAGYIRFNATENDTFLVFAFGDPTQNFPGDTASGHDSVFITTGSDVIDDIQGYTTSVGSPSSANTTRMYAYAYDSKGNPVENAILTSQLNTLGSEVEDTCSTFIPVKFNAKARSKATGFVFLDLLQNDCLVGGDTYTFMLRLNARSSPIFTVKMAVPTGVGSARITAQ